MVITIIVVSENTSGFDSCLYYGIRKIAIVFR